MVMTMNVAMLYSGGKDSNLALYRLAKEGHTIVALLSAVSKRDDSWMFHVPNVELCSIQADCLGIPWERIEVSGVKEDEVSELYSALSRLIGKLKIDAVGSGAIASNYQRERVAKTCSQLGLAALSPLWGMDERSMLWEMLSLSFEIYFTSVSAEGFGRNWLGRRLDDSTIGSLLKLNALYGINVSGEGGEYETFVADMPLFSKRIRILDSESKWVRNSGTWVIKKVELSEKAPQPIK